MTDLKNLGTLLAMGQPPAPSGTTPNATGQLLSMLVFMGLGFVVLYLIAIRPQQKRQRQQAEMLKSIRAGDKIMSTGGVIATVITVKEKSLSIRSADSKMEIARSAVSEILERSGDSRES